ncbi:hypothetical protein M0804_000831 [Polistes exclamans]|nr:hypothetical protein M0804_000831 [Polistes exclamans]
MPTLASRGTKRVTRKALLEELYLFESEVDAMRHDGTGPDRTGRNETGWDGIGWNRTGWDGNGNGTGQDDIKAEITRKTLNEVTFPTILDNNDNSSSSPTFFWSTIIHNVAFLFCLPH